MTIVENGEGKRVKTGHMIDKRGYPTIGRPLVKSVYQKINFLISQPKHMLWVLKRTVPSL